MTEPKTKKLSRRDAIKLLGAAAGATVLANLPSKWNTPSIIRGVLPAHAQTSLCYAARFEILTAVGGDMDGGNISGPGPDEQTWNSGLPGEYVAWYCQTGCLHSYLALGAATSGSIQVTTLTSSFVLNFDAGTVYQEVLIDLGTGDYALNGVGVAGSCSWPQIPFAPSQGTPWGN